MKFTDDMLAEDEKRWHARDVVTELGYCGNYMRDRKDMTNIDIRFYAYIMRKAHEMLKEQQPRVVTLEEVKAAAKQPAWRETRSKNKYLYNGWALIYDVQMGMGITGERVGMSEPSGRVGWYKAEDYGKTWRCWSAKPSEEQRRETAWE